MKLLLAADVFFTNQQQEITQQNAPTLVQALKPIFDRADFRIANLETVLYESDENAIVKSGPALHSQPDSLCFYNALGIDAVGLANNHFGDHSIPGMEASFAYLRQNNIAFVGAGHNIDEAYRALRLEKDNISVSVIAACENEFGTASENRMGTAGYDLSRLINAIRCEKTVSDYVVVYFHGGNEQNPFPSPEKVTLYRLWADLGADAVIAMHTHCPQGYEIYNGKPIIYSMGNFFFPKSSVIPGPYDPHDPWNFGYLTELDFTKDGVALQLHPYHVNDFQPIELLTGKSKEKFMAYLSKLSEPLTDRKQLLHLFKIWCTISGVGYVKLAKFQPELLQGDQKAGCFLRNLFTCEAHNELMRTLLEMCYHNELEQYTALQSEITTFQKIIV